MKRFSNKLGRRMVYGERLDLCKHSRGNPFVFLHYAVIPQALGKKS